MACDRSGLLRYQCRAARSIRTRQTRWPTNTGLVPRTIEKFAALYREEMSQAYKIQKEWEQEFASRTRAEQDAYYREQELAAGEEEPNPVFHEQCRAFLDAEAAEAYRVRLACPHRCYEGCRKSTLLIGQHLCALRSANK